MGGRVNWVWVSTQTANSSDGGHEGRRVPADPMLQRSLSLAFFFALEVFSFPLSPHFRSLHVPPFCGRVILPRKCTLLRVLNPSPPFYFTVEHMASETDSGEDPNAVSFPWLRRTSGIRTVVRLLNFLADGPTGAGSKCRGKKALSTLETRVSKSHRKESLCRSLPFPLCSYSVPLSFVCPVTPVAHPRTSCAKLLAPRN